MVAPQDYDFSDLATAGVLNINHSYLRYKGIASFCLDPSCDCVHNALLNDPASAEYMS